MKQYLKKCLSVLVVMLLIVSVLPTALAQEQETNGERTAEERLYIESAENSRAVSPGETLQLTALNAEDDPVAVNWSVDRLEIASIDENGLLTGIEDGQGVVVTASLKSNPEIKGTKTIAVTTGVCQVIGGTYYKTLEEGIKAAPIEGSVGIIRSTTITEKITIDKNLTLSSIRYDPDDDTTLSVVRENPNACLKVLPGVKLKLERLLFNGNKEALGNEKGVTFLTIEEGATTTMNFNGIIYNAAAESGPGGILNKGTLEMYGSSLTFCESLTDAGGLRNEGKMLVFGGFITNNSGINGGGIYNTGTLEMSSGEERSVYIESNEASENGGGVYNSGNLIMRCGLVSGNTALNGTGGGIYQNGTLTLKQDDKMLLNIKDNIGDDLYLTTGKNIELDDTAINDKSVIYIASQEMGPDKAVDIIHQKDGEAITSSYPFLPSNDTYSIDQKPGDPSTLQLTAHGKVYLGPDGDDKNDGTTVNNAVKSLERAAEIGKKKRQFYVCVLPANDKGETAVLSNTVDLSKVLTEFVSCDINGEIIQEPDKGNSITRINPSATIQFGEDSYAELSNVTLDGGSLTANVPLVSVIGSSEGQGLSLNKGTIIQNAKSSGDCGGMSIGLELKTEFTITATAAANGTISPSGNITVNEGQSQSFTTTPSTGYDIADVVVDGKSVGAQASYTFENISENHSIAATFKVKSNEQYSVTIQTDGTGTAAASVTSAAKGTIVSLKATPSNGYQFKAWQVVSGNLKIENNQFTMPAENVILKAVFEKTPANGGNIKTGMTDTKTGTASAIMLLSIAGISLLVFKRKLNKK